LSGRYLEPTLWIKIYLRPRQWVKQKLRLRGLDCPEPNTPEGMVPKTTAITINTTKPDKYDRYLADVFLAGFADQKLRAESPEAQDEIYLNKCTEQKEMSVKNYCANPRAPGIHY
jgi:hypothetical protein